ncbi:MAG: TetR/AcrR family transcriptional regulator [Candidatus Lokiarchaeota archaeon]
MNAAKDLFSKESFDTISMEEIAGATALSRATLYNYFNTKEEIYFNIALDKVEDWIEMYELLKHKDYSGKALVIKLTEELVKDILEYPHYSKLIRRFFYRSNDLNLPIEEIFYNKLIKNIESQNKTNFTSQNKIFLQLLDVYVNYRALWQNAINMGIKDGSITSKSNPSHLNFMIIMLILGLLDQIDFRRSLMEMVEISDGKITQFILKLVTKILEGEI